MIVNVLEVAPAGTVMLAGTLAFAEFLLESVTTAPAAGAGAESVTVAVTGVPPTTLVEANVSAASVTGALTAGLTVNVAVFSTPL